MGLEVELLAPRGASRRDLADELARRCGGRVRPVFHTDSEPSAAPGVERFLHLTPGFDVLDAAGALRCSLVDDTTIVADLDPGAPPRPGWYRILSDDPRLLRLVAARTDPAEGIGSVLAPVAELFGVEVETLGAVRRVQDAAGATIALAAPLPGERERPCEVVTPPLAAGHREALEPLLSAARDLGFTVPREAAVHLHVDGAPFQQAVAFSNVVRLFGTWRAALWELFATNPHCRRLAPLPAALVELVEEPGADWERLRTQAAGTGVSKFCDVNLARVLGLRPGPQTLEVRLLPGAIDADEVLAQVLLVQRLLDRCRDERPFPRPRAGEGSAAELLALVGG
ncbi:amidoligase family protein [Kineococcus rubinsiae]|uniref:amidoligase family protein n=1 Tax=Kineococcus rubinsiae TaxID=2609562 RepID=UPI0027E3F890|nr:amidoligase family protein [Kineococcus rubinsiae]